MASITRDRGCMYYVPWIAILCLAFGGAGLGVWVVYMNKCKDLCWDGLDELDVGARHLNRFDDALLATAICYMVMLVIVFLLSLWRSFIEAAHDATGMPGRGAMAFMVVAFLTNTGLTLLMAWLVLLLMASSVWLSSVYIFNGAIDKSLQALDKYGSATWLPSLNEPCPGQCLDVTAFVFLTYAYQDSCVCDAAKLRTTKQYFDRAYDKAPGVLVGNWVMLAAGVLLVIDYACQLAHTKRERELLRRISYKVYSSV